MNSLKGHYKPPMKQGSVLPPYTEGKGPCFGPLRNALDHSNSQLARYDHPSYELCMIYYTLYIVYYLLLSIILTVALVAKSVSSAPGAGAAPWAGRALERGTPLDPQRSRVGRLATGASSTMFWGVQCWY